jgi:hypothetical protein
MNSISTTYALKYRVKFAPNYCFDINNQCWNVKSGRPIKKVIVSRSIGYCISGKFYSLTFLRKHLEKIPSEKLPF